MGGILDFLGSSAGNAAGGVIKDSASAIGGLAKDIRSAFTGELSEAAQLKLAELDKEAQALQTAVNQAEAANGNMFVSGWRPFIGWVCGIGLTYQLLLWPFLVWISKINNLPVPPELDQSILMTLVTGMLGLAGMRSWEKKNNVARK